MIAPKQPHKLQRRGPVKRAFTGLAGSPSARAVETEELRQQRLQEQAKATASAEAEAAGQANAEPLGKMDRTGTIPIEAQVPRRRGRPRLNPEAAQTPKERTQRSRARKAEKIAARAAETQRQCEIAEIAKDQTQEKVETRGRQPNERVGPVEKIAAARSKPFGPPKSAPQHFFPGLKIVEGEFQATTVPDDSEEGAKRQGRGGGIRGEGTGQTLDKYENEARTRPSVNQEMWEFVKKQRGWNSVSQELIEYWIMGLAQEAQVSWFDADGKEQHGKGAFAGTPAGIWDENPGPGLTCRPCGTLVRTWEDACEHLWVKHPDDVRKYLRRSVRAYKKHNLVSKPKPVCTPEAHERMRTNYVAAGHLGAFECGVCHQQIDVPEQARPCTEDHENMIRIHRLRWIKRFQKPLQCHECGLTLLIPPYPPA